MTETFFKDLPALSPADGLCVLGAHQSVPSDWFVVVADIVNSTEAVAAGQYKEVNMASASVITAVLNAVGEARDTIAYVFGGDGATFLVPKELKEQVAAALYGARKMAKRSFNLDMRAGIVDVASLLAEDMPVKIAKIELAPGLYQAAFLGQGIILAEQWIKCPERGAQYDVLALFDEKTLSKKRPSFKGMGCRWKPLRSRNGLNATLIVQGRLGNDQKNAELYQSVLTHVRDICGEREDWCPISERQLNMSGAPASVLPEVQMNVGEDGFFVQLWFLIKALALSWLGKFCVAYRLKAGPFDGKTYKKEMVENSDYIKFDNALRLVMDISAAQKEELQAYLDEQLKAGHVFYGMHVAFSALMTCLVFSFEGEHLHFIDGAEGGYSLAAIQLKQQIKKAS